MHGAMALKKSITERALASVRPPSQAPISYQAGLGWFACYCGPQSERRAAMGLNANRIEAYLPIQVRQRVRRGRVYKREMPVFIRYLFVRFDPYDDEAHNAIVTTDGIEELLENNMIPVRIPDKFIEAIRRAEQNGVFNKDANICAGDSVRIPEGPYADFMGKVASITPAKRLKVLLEGMGRLIPVEFGLADVEQIT